MEKLKIELKGKCIACKHWCSATSECRKAAPSGAWPNTQSLQWCGNYAKSKDVEFE